MEAKLENEISGNDCYECTFYKSMEFCENQARFDFKHILINTNDMDLSHENMKQMENTYHTKTKIEKLTP
jgi:hypothetical protein